MACWGCLLCIACSSKNSIFELTMQAQRLPVLAQPRRAALSRAGRLRLSSATSWPRLRPSVPCHR